MENRASKGAIANRLYDNGGYTRTQSVKVVTDVLEAMFGLLRDGHSVVLSNIGTLRVAAQPPRSVRNPRTGETWTTKDQTVIRWKTSDTMKDVINGRSDRATIATKRPKGSR